MSDAGYWRELGRRWLEAPRQRLWRRFHDRAVLSWVAGNLPRDPGRLLKTDLFEEAVGEPLLEVIAEGTGLAMGIDLALPLAAAGAGRCPGGAAVVAEVGRLPFPGAGLDVVVSTSTHRGCRNSTPPQDAPRATRQYTW